jgi:hypothetical protein
MALTRRAGLDTVTTFLAPLLGLGLNTVRQRLREFYQEAQAKAGACRGIKRRDFDVTDCFAPLLAWVLSFWSHRRLALALDATNLADRFHVLCVSVLFGGIGIPVAWKILPGGQKDPWHPHWCDLLGALRAAVGDGWQVVVLSDRGLESTRLFEAVVGLGWHPLMRVKAGGKFRPAGWVGWYKFGELVPRVGIRFASAGLAYKTASRPLACTLLGCWEAGHAEPWLLLTDLGPAAAAPCWYAFRAWVEQGFKVIKGEGLCWQKTRIEDAGRAERQWLALAVATLRLVAIGAEVERRAAVETVGELPEEQPSGRPRGRKYRLFKVGAGVLLAALLRGEGLPEERLYEEAWPEVTHDDVPIITEQQFLSDKTYP